MGQISDEARWVNDSLPENVLPKVPAVDQRSAESCSVCMPVVNDATIRYTFTSDSDNTTLTRSSWKHIQVLRNLEWTRLSEQIAHNHFVCLFHVDSRDGVLMGSSGCYDMKVHKLKETHKTTVTTLQLNTSFNVFIVRLRRRFWSGGNTSDKIMSLRSERVEFPVWRVW